VTSDGEDNRTVFTVLALLGVPVLIGMGLQFLLAPEAPEWGTYETIGIAVGFLLALGYIGHLALERVRKRR
jgi:hypothetical protein